MEYSENYLDSFPDKDGKLLGWRNLSKSLRPGGAEPVLTGMATSLEAIVLIPQKGPKDTQPFLFCPSFVTVGRGLQVQLMAGCSFRS